MRGDRDARVAATLRRIILDTVIPAGKRARRPAVRGSSRWASLFRPELLVATLFLWLTFFMSFCRVLSETSFGCRR